ncbi:MAG: UPF0262 family protein [Alphaproteobacteria bacterium]|nr:UPF0262 family protein [Alphaproteobacteria bacterium]
MGASGQSEGARIVHLSLDDPALAARNADLEHERRVAIFDILENNHFALVDGPEGPYRLTLSLADRGILFAVSDKDDAELRRIELSMTPFRRNIRDYFMICESYFEAMRNATPERVETIDGARRALHNESAELLKTRLSDKVVLDDDTARRLFTLISVLQMRG